MSNADQFMENVEGLKAQRYIDLYNNLQGPLFWYAWKYLGDQKDAEDVVQEVFLKLWNNMDELTHVEDFRAYMFRMTGNYCLNVLQRRNLKDDVYKELASRSETVVDAEISLAELQSELMEFYLEDLTEKSNNYKSVFKMSYLEGQKNEEVASALHISNGAVRTIKKHLRRMLKRKILSPTIYFFIVCLFFYK